MKIHYDAETDSLYIDLVPGPGADSREIAAGVVGDFDAHGRLVGLDFEYASRHLALDVLEVDALPVKVTAATQPRTTRKRA